MRMVIDAFWRAVLYCWHPSMIGLSLVPVVVSGVALAALGYFFWDPALVALGSGLETLGLTHQVGEWLSWVGLGRFNAVWLPLLLVVVATPVVVVGVLLLVSVLMMPVVVNLVARRRFPDLQRQHGASWWQGFAWSIGSTIVALVALVLSVPWWLVPPLAVVLPPLIWGWLTYRVMVFDALADHASADERRLIFKQHRKPLWAMGVAAGFLGAAPSLLWGMGAMALAFAPILLPLAVALYTWVFAFCGLWFTHYTLAALDQLRTQPIDV